MAYIAYITAPYLRYSASVCPGQRSSPVAVVERNTVVSAAPELMAMGVRAGHSRRQAKHVCPEVSFVEQNTDSSQALANMMWDVCAGYTPLVEPVGIDSGFIDITGCGEATSIISAICRKCAEQLGVSLYICVAPTKLVARAGVPDAGAPSELCGYTLNPRLISWLRCLWRPCGPWAGMPSTNSIVWASAPSRNYGQCPSLN